LTSIARRHHDFLHGIPHFAISIHSSAKGTIVAGIVYIRSMTSSSPPKRARARFLNDQRRGAARRRLADADRGLRSCRPTRGDVALARSEHPRAGPRSRIARFGAAALDLAWVAAGRLDAYLGAQASRPWVWRGIALVREAELRPPILDGPEGTCSRPEHHCRHRCDPSRLLRR